MRRRELLTESGEDGLEGCIGLIHRCIGPQSSQHQQPVHIPVAEEAPLSGNEGVLHQGRPEIHVPSQRLVPLECFRSHAYHRIGDAVQRDGPAEDVPSSSEPARQIW